MLRNRLLFGTLMTLCFAVLVAADAWLEGQLTGSGLPVRGTVICGLLGVLAAAGQLELSKLAAAKGLRVLLPVAIPGSILLATFWYWVQFAPGRGEVYLVFLLGLLVMATFACQYASCGTSGTLGNCGVTSLSICYLGVLISFVLGIRIDFGIWVLLMFVFVVKSADIGAYTAGSLFGRHKFSPKVSPGKTWEGMFGAVLAAAIVAVGFGVICDIMPWWAAVVFGVLFAFIGQMGDLAESMLKRDAAQKDSAGHVPGFGGLLDVIDSTLVAAPFSYLFFMWSSRLCR
jgi:phosphatidate cytidylyltransferase